MSKRKAKLNYSNDTLLFENTRKTLQNEQKLKLPWFAYGGVVLAITVFCSLYDGGNLYISFSNVVRDNYILTILLAVGATFLLNVSMTILAYMYKGYKQGYDEIEKWMIILFAVVIATFFVSIFAFRYATAYSPFQSQNSSVSLSGVTVTGKSNVSDFTKYVFATIVNISSLVSSVLCFFVSYYNSDPKAKRELAQQETKVDLYEQKAYMIGCEHELDKIDSETLNDLEKQKYYAANAVTDADAIVLKNIYRNELEKAVGNPEQINVITENGKKLLNNKEN